VRGDGGSYKAEDQSGGERTLHRDVLLRPEDWVSVAIKGPRQETISGWPVHLWLGRFFHFDAKSIRHRETHKKAAPEEAASDAKRMNRD